MNRIPKSGLYNTNNFGRIALLSYQAVLGPSGLNALLNLAGLRHIINNYPPANLERGFEFADYTAILVALEELYGVRGGRGLALRVGRETFQDILDNYGELAGVMDLAFKVMPLALKMRMGLSRAARTFTQVSDQKTSLAEEPDKFIWTIHQCPSCWSRLGVKAPVCFVTVGFLQSAVKWVSNGRDFRVQEVYCHAMGDPACTFFIHKEPIGGR